MVHSKKILSVSLIAIFAFLLLVVGLTAPLDVARAEEEPMLVLDPVVQTTATPDFFISPRAENHFAFSALLHLS